MKDVYYSTYDLHKADWFPLKQCAITTLVNKGVLKAEYIAGRRFITKASVDEFLKKHHEVTSEWTPSAVLRKELGQTEYARLAPTMEKMRIGEMVYCRLVLEKIPISVISPKLIGAWTDKVQELLGPLPDPLDAEEKKSKK